MVSQDTSLFDSTVGFNIRYGNLSANDAAVVAAATAAQVTPVGQALCAAAVACSSAQRFASHHMFVCARVVRCTSASSGAPVGTSSAWGSTARRCRAANGSGCASRVRCSRTRPCCCATRSRAPWTLTPSEVSSRRSESQTGEQVAVFASFPPCPLVPMLLPVFALLLNLLCLPSFDGVPQRAHMRAGGPPTRDGAARTSHPGPRPRPPR